MPRNVTMGSSTNSTTQTGHDIRDCVCLSVPSMFGLRPTVTYGTYYLPTASGRGRRPIRVPNPIRHDIKFIEGFLAGPVAIVHLLLDDTADPYPSIHRPLAYHTKTHG